MRTYIHERNDWPQFTWNRAELADALRAIHHKQGRLFGRMEGLGFEVQQRAQLRTLTEDIVKTSEIEGEHLDTAMVRSSVAQRLGMEKEPVLAVARDVEGVVEMMLDATQRYSEPLTKKRLFGWHASLFPTGWSHLKQIRMHGWRDETSGEMEVVSGAFGKQRVHFCAPDASRLDEEMDIFLRWFNEENETDWVAKAAIAHLWFVTIHPFEDGNGRIARAIADLCLARSEDSTQRFYSMSAQIRRERNEYYAMLEGTQRGEMDITRWMRWFFACLERAIEGAHEVLSEVLGRARFWQAVGDAPLNYRQRKVLERMLDGFEGKLTTSKWSKIATCSQDTAHRDIKALMERGLLRVSSAKGRSTSYEIPETLLRGGR